MAIGAVKAIEGGGTAMANFAGGMAKGFAKGAIFQAVMGDASELGAAHAAERSGGAAGKTAAKPVQSAQGSTETDSHSNTTSGTPKQNGYAINEHALRDAVHSGNTAVLRSVSSLLNDEGLRDILGHKTFNMFRSELDGAFGRAFGLSDLANSIVPPGFFSAGATVSALVRASSQGVTRAATSVSRGLGNQNPLYKAAVQRFKSTDLSNAGRALTKHPEVVGLTKDTLRHTLRSDAAINDAAHGALRDIMRNGAATTPTLGRYGTVTQIQKSGGFGARWASDGSFIGFINP